MEKTANKQSKTNETRTNNKQLNGTKGTNRRQNNNMKNGKGTNNKQNKRLNEKNT